MGVVKDKPRRGVMTNIHFLISNAWRWDKGLFALFGLSIILGAVLPFVGIFAPKFVIDELTGARRVQVLVSILVIYFILSAAIEYLVAYLKSICFPRLIGVRFKYMNMLHEKSMVMDFKHTENPKTLNDIQSAWMAVDNNDYGIEGIFHRIFSLFSSALAFGGYVTIVATLNPLVLAYLIANVLIVYFLTLKVKKYEHSKKDELSELDRKAGYIYETMYDFSYGKDIRIYSLGNWLSNKFQSFKAARLEVSKDIRYKYFATSVVDVILLLIREGIIYAYLIFRVAVGGMGIGDFSMYFATIGGFAGWMQRIMDDIAHIRAQNLYLNDFRDFLELPDEVKNPDPMTIPEDLPYEIEFQNVSFKYPGSDRYIFKNLSLKIEKGQRLAIVGINGAGKTTL